MKLAFACVVTLSIFASSVHAQSASPTSGFSPTQHVDPTVPKLPNTNVEVLRLAIEDQWDRGNDMFGGRQLEPPNMNGKSVSARDEEREVSIRKLLAEGQVKSGTDYWLCALIFQHSTKAEGVLLAHVLATTAASKGNTNGKWLSAASLDRYLWYVGQPQVFGTQYKRDEKGKWTMEPYARGTLSDADRAAWCVVPIARQREILRDYQQDKPPAPTGVDECK